MWTWSQILEGTQTAVPSIIIDQNCYCMLLLPSFELAELKWSSPSFGLPRRFVVVMEVAQ